MKILVSGANGFVGRELCGRLINDGHDVVPIVRRASGSLNEVIIDDINGDTDWSSALTGCDAVVHLAARVHVMEDKSSDPLAEYRAVNTAGTLNLARQAAQSGIRRFIFLSSVKVNGESGTFSDASEPLPRDVYAISKWEAEQGLHRVSRENGMGVVILRPPLVYGPGVGANFLRLMRAVDRGMPLPFGSIRNRRSMIYLGNLVDAIVICVTHSAALGKTYLLSDGEQVSTAELVGYLAKSLGRSPRLLPVPSTLIRLVGQLLGRRKELDRLLGTLTVDNSAFRRDVAWVPPYSMQEGVAITATWYQQQKNYAETRL